jgi:CubicO group peptidase (beta-lactamase class C family)
MCYRFLIILLLPFSMSLNAQSKAALSKAALQNQRINEPVFNNFIRQIDSAGLELHSFVLTIGGKKILDANWQPYSGRNKHILYSMTKSFVSLAIGCAIEDSLVHEEDYVRDFFPEWRAEAQGPYFDQLKVKHLLSMTVGQHAEGPYADPIALAIEKKDDWVKLFFKVPILKQPGSVFLYNTLASHVLSAIVAKATGKSTQVYLSEKIFNPLGIKDLDWEVSPTGIHTGGWGLRLTMEGMVKIGQLMLQKGKWKNRQLLSEKWIQQSTTYKIHPNNITPTDSIRKTDWVQGYGYQWWLYDKGIYAAQGSEGQAIMVLPQQDAVIAYTGNITDRQTFSTILRRHLIDLLPIKGQKSTFTLSISKSQKTKPIQPPKGIQVPFNNHSFKLKTNAQGLDSVHIIFKKELCQLQLFYATKQENVYCGKEKWIANTTNRKSPYRMHSPTTFNGLPPFKIVASYCLQDAETLQFTIRYLESPHFETIVCRKTEGKTTLKITSSMNVSRQYVSE